MRIKRLMGSCILALTAVFVNLGSASLAAVGVEEIPESIKDLR